jgi:hypothetical protein
LVLCTTRAVLEAVNGFCIGRSYHEAVASEIAISKKVQALGLTIKQIGPLPFTYIEHPQWAQSGRWHLSPLARYRKLVRAGVLAVTPEFLREQLDYLMLRLGKCYRPPPEKGCQERL